MSSLVGDSSRRYVGAVVADARGTISSTRIITELFRGFHHCDAHNDYQTM